MKRVIIVGGGISGLSTALRLHDAAATAHRPVEVVVLEASDRPGGNIRTDRRDGYLIETGPNGFLDNAPRTLELARRLGLQRELQRADESAAKRFIFRGGRLHELPSGPLGLLRSPLLSPRGRLRVFAEPLARRPPAGESDETVFDFAARRIGPEAASVLVDAMVSGVFAGDARRLSLQSSFPKMAAMEREHGSLVRAMLARMRARRRAKRAAARGAGQGDGGAQLGRPGGPAGPGGTLTTVRGGLDRLVAALARELGDRLQLERRVVAVEPVAEREPGSGARPWRVQLECGTSLAGDAVVSAIPAPAAARLLEPLDQQLGATVGQIATAGLAVVALAYDARTIAPLDGFGFLVPRTEGVRILGCLWDSSIFPDRAPSGHALLRAMIGGAHDPAAVSEPEQQLVECARRDLAKTMGLEAEPEWVRLYRWPLGIGQYHVGHAERLERIHRRLRAHPGLWVAGSSYYGVSMNACIEKSFDQATEILDHLAR